MRSSVIARNAICLPVEKSGEDYVLADDWFRCGLSFPSVSQLRILLRGPHHTAKGRVLYDSSLLPATIYTPSHGDDLAFAIIDKEDLSKDSRITLRETEFSQYFAGLQARCLYSEFILPEQRGYIESDFVQPSLRSIGDTARDVQWNELARANRLMIVGTAGAGKTTLLRRLILSELKHFKPDVSRLPVYVPLRNWHPEQGIGAQVKRELAELGGETLAANFDQLAALGQLSLAFDGLDEIPAERRELAYAALHTFLDKNSECHTIVSTRWGVTPRSFDNFLKVEIRPFNANQMQELIYHKLCDDRSWVTFFHRLLAEPKIFDLAGNPLILTLLIARFARKQVKPSYISEVLEVISRALLDEWDAVRGVVRWKSAELSATRKATYLRLVATHLAEARRDSFSTSDVSNVLERFSLQLPALTLLQTLEESTSFITRLPNGEWAFRSKLIRDYFSALHWVERLTTQGESVVRELVSTPTEWLIIRFRLLAGLSSDPSDLVRNALQVLLHTMWRPQSLYQKL